MRLVREVSQVWHQPEASTKSAEADIKNLFYSEERQNNDGSQIAGLLYAGVGRLLFFVRGHAARDLVPH
jgi:hypothetical protein